MATNPENLPPDNMVDSLAGIMSAAREIAQVSDHAIPFVLLPKGYDVHALEKLLPEPIRKRGAFGFRSVESFAAYWTDHKVPGRTVTLANRDAPEIVAYLNGHNAGDVQAGWHDHTATLEFHRTVEWLIWTQHSGKRMHQSAFAEFIEDNAADIAEPAGAVMLELVTRLEATKNLVFRQGVNLANGTVEFQYDETMESRAGKGKVVVPSEFYIGVAPFEGSRPYKVLARFRHRIENSKLAMWFDLDRPHKIEQAAFEAAVADVKAATKADVLFGHREDSDDE